MIHRLGLHTFTAKGVGSSPGEETKIPTNHAAKKKKSKLKFILCSPWGRLGSDTTERLRFLFSLSCIGEGNDNPLQCSCLENPRDRGAWWAAVYGVAQSRT